MPTKSSDRRGPVPADREYYQQLWRTGRGAVRAHDRWSTVRRRSGSVALIASIALAGHLALSSPDSTPLPLIDERASATASAFGLASPTPEPARRNTHDEAAGVIDLLTATFSDVVDLMAIATRSP